jgi:hypothetical protein
LECNAQAQADPSDPLLAQLITQMGKAQRVFVFEMRSLNLEELRLLLQEGLGLLRNARIISRQPGGYGRGERFSASQGL